MQEVVHQANANVAEHVGANVARFRQLRGQSLSELAIDAGVSKRTLSNVEKGSNVTLETLLAIADGLRVDLVTLLFDGYQGPNGQIQVVRTEEVEPVDLGAQLVRHLCQSQSLPSLRLAHLTFRAGRHQTNDATPTGTVIRLFVLSGQVTFGPLDSPVRLDPGDFATIRADQPHVIGADGGESTGLLLTTFHS